MSTGRIVAFVPDLFFSVRVGDVVRSLGFQPHVVDRADQLVAALQPQANVPPPVLVIVDINAPPEQWSPAVRELKNDTARRHIPVLAFGSHLDVERQQAARDAGCDRVVANSKFHEALASLVQTMTQRDQ